MKTIGPLSCFIKSPLYLFPDLFCFQYNETGTRWPTLCMRHFWIHFRQKRCLCLDPNVTKFIPKSQVDNKLALIQVLAWCRTCSKHYLKQWWTIYVSPSCNELILRASNYLLLLPSFYVTSEAFHYVLFDRRKLASFSIQVGCSIEVVYSFCHINFSVWNI